MLLNSEYSPVFKTLLLIVGIRVTVDGNDKNLGNVYLATFKDGN